MTFNTSIENNIRKMKTECQEDFSTLDWAAISNFRYLSEDFIEEFSEKVVWKNICTSQKLSEDFINKFIDKVDLKIIISLHSNRLSEGFIKKLREENYEIFSTKKNIKKTSQVIYNASIENIIRKMKTECQEDFSTIDWAAISNFRYLSEDFIEEFSEYVVWKNICTSQKLSEDFINKFIDKVDLKIISIMQASHLSLDFIIRHKEKMNMNLIKKNKKIFCFENDLSSIIKENKSIPYFNEFLLGTKNYYDDLSYDYIVGMGAKVVKTYSPEKMWKSNEHEYYNERYNDYAYLEAKILRKI